MGHRANYVLIENGKAYIYFSRWGALDIPAMLLAGPESAISYVRALTTDDHLQNEDWAEGGVILDVDRRLLRFFGGGDVEFSPYLRRPLFRALRTVWPNWDVEWSLFGIADLAVSLGQDSSRVLVTEDDDSEFLSGVSPIIQEDDVQAAESLRQAESIFIVRWSDTDVRDYLLTPHMEYALTLGPRLLDFLWEMSPIELPGEGDSGIPTGVACLDVSTHRLWMSRRDRFYPRYVTAIARRWFGWQVDIHLEGLTRQIELSGREPTPYMIPDEQAVMELIAVVTRRSIDPANLYQALLNHGKSSGESENHISVGRGFFSSDKPPLSPDELRDLLLSVLHAPSSEEGAALPSE